VLLQEWAGVLASPDVLRMADGCATAEDAALMAAIAGKSSNYITQALDVCLQGLQHWEAGNTPVGSSCQHQRCGILFRIRHLHI
jgi:hypothetical protein